MVENGTIIINKTTGNVFKTAKKIIRADFKEIISSKGQNWEVASFYPIKKLMKNC